MPLEKSITNAILSYLNGLNRTVAEKIQGNASSSGKADINGCIRGKAIRIEVKTPDNGNKASSKQAINLKRWNAAGAFTMVAYSLDEVKQALYKAHIINAKEAGKYE